MTKFREEAIELDDGRRLAYHRPHDEAAGATPSRHEKIKFNEHIPNPCPLLEVEIGSGTGRFIAERAIKYPERFFLGIDKKRDRIDSTFHKLERTGQKNWALLRTDARSFLDEKLPPIQVFHVYHPDPWPKKRHHKHRFFRSPDARHWSDAIVRNGELRVSTDQADYFEEILATIASWKTFRLQLAFVKRSGRAASRFEEIFLSKNEPVYKAYFKKT